MDRDKSAYPHCLLCSKRRQVVFTLGQHSQDGLSTGALIILSAVLLGNTNKASQLWYLPVVGWLNYQGLQSCSRVFKC